MRDGSTIQFGIGGMPDTIGRMLCDSDLKDLGMHTEMLVDAYFDLFEAGKLTNRCKNIDRGKGVFAFSVGGRTPVRMGRPQPGPGLLPGGLHQRPVRHRGQRQCGGHQQLRGGGPLRPGELRIVRPAPDQRHRRAAGLHHRRLHVAGWQGLPLPVVHVHRQEDRRAPLPRSADPAGGQHGNRSAFAEPLRRHRVRHRRPARPLHLGARRAGDRDRAPAVPRRPHPRSPEDEDLAGQQPVARADPKRAGPEPAIIGEADTPRWGPG